ncbi:type-F conjugative transfer system mating-pair stabilization protein TraN, partial [Escherichia coli]|nr:type-F conjugative transfer system mating-pair stabilization protein TraN [Escherichia coli]EJF7554109.1 type-F conjugative transfer system mating-pair stabilization protein TraN [Escherichia coli]EJF7691723.1 type-F conjugative transfer system mating-pair stabilization protein TraN [Escherichia coli]EJF7704538.1 type-F conjugative transfer system mating-pair stabilization protein TraN [Escherichia coli]EJF7741093.1 type-F conjugative transfer system mating-pair stabilization protein TraN [E
MKEKINTFFRSLNFNYSVKPCNLCAIVFFLSFSVFADSNSDYRAGSDFAHQIKGQGSSSIQGFKPQESIPGYNANPDETKYYGGVTAGGDGGLKNDGTTEWATGETGKTITESFMNKPKDILSPDAPFIQTGRDVVNRADSIVGNTGQQCSAQEISRSEYTNYTCERDLQVEQYCTRTARMELQGNTTWETRTLEYEMSQLPAREVNGQYVVSITSPVTGEIVDAHYSWSRTYLQKSVPMTITVLGTPLSWNAKYSADASFTPVQKTLTAGVAFTSSHPVRVGNTKFKRHTAMKLRLVVRVKKASYTPYVVWSESCPFSKELGKLTKTECTEAGGNRTLVKDGQSYSMYQSCWAYRDTYVTQSADKGTCQTYTDNPACTLVSHQCAFYSEEGACLHEYATYSCESKTSGKVMVCGGDVFCLDGECDKAQSGQSNDFAEAVSQLAALAAAGKDVAALNGVDVRAFTGQAKFCKKAAAGYSNCCKDSGWGQDIGLAKCSSDEKALAKAKSNKLTVSVGEFCSKKVLGVCLEKKRSYCQFDSKLAQIPEQLSLRREHAVNEVYVIAGGEWLRNNLNAIAAFMGTRTWDSIEKIALTLSVLAVAVIWVQRHNVMDLLGWVAVFVLISLLVNVRTSVQIIDNSDLVKVHRVDNVPVGLAMPLSLTTRIGHAMVRGVREDQKNGWLFISSNADTHASLKPVISMWLSIAIRGLLAMGENRNRRVWFFCDELPTLHKLPDLVEILPEARKFGGCYVFGIQSYAQLEDIYGEKAAATLFDVMNTRAFFRSPSHKIAEFAAGEIGEKEHLKASEQYSYGADPVRDGVSTGKDMERQTLVSYSDIQSLPDLTCYVTLPGPYPAVKLSLKYQERPKVAPEFIPREINPEMENRLSAVLAAREAEGRQMASLFEPDVPEVVSGEDVVQA